MTLLEAICEYQVPGAVGDFNPKTATFNHGWTEHVPGTVAFGIGRILLGMPKGFDRVGPIDLCEGRALWIYETWEEHQAHWSYDKFNVPVWKYLDEHGNTIVRGLSPRVNSPFLHVILGDYRDKINCLELTKADLAEMD